MNNSVLTKYYLWKKKTILSYSKIIETIVSTQDNDIWKNRKEFDILCKNIINEYVDNYLFNENNTNKDDGIDIDIKSKELDKIFLAISDYFKKINSLDRINNNKKETLLLTMIIYSSSALDEMNSPFNMNVDYVETINKLLEDYKEMKLFQVKDNIEIQANKLIETLKSNRSKEKKLFELLSNNDSYNKYISVSKKTNMYIVEYNYYIKGIEKFNKKEVLKVFSKKNVFDNLCFISLDLVINTMLKETSLRKKISNYVLVVNKNFYKKLKNLTKLDKELGDLKKKIQLLITYDEYVNEEELMSKIRNLGFKILVDAHMNEEIEKDKINPKDKILVTKHIDGFNNIIIFDDGTKITENELLNIKISEELK